MSTDASAEPEKAGWTGSPHDPEQQIVIDGISYIPSSVLLTGIPKVSFKDNSAFAVLDTQGESPRIYTAGGGSELGFYFHDTRFISTWEMTFNGARPVALTHELRHAGHTTVFSMTNRDLATLGAPGRIPRDMLLFRRILTLCEDTLYEIVEIKNFDSVAHALQVEQWAGGKFDDVFEVRGFARPKRGRMLAPMEEPGPNGPVTVLRYEGLDSQLRKVAIARQFPAEKVRLSPSLVGYFTRVEVPPKESVSLRTAVSFTGEFDGKILGEDFSRISVPELMTGMSRWSESSPFAELSIHTDNAIVNRAIRNAQTDIFMLLTEESGSILYPYAGVPWFSAPFGRDGMITAYQLLPWHPNLAQGVLDFAFMHLGTKVDPFTDEQPGKVFHEFRRGEMARTREIPFIPYFGSVDSTPLALILLHEYVRWTSDLENLRRWWPEALRALEWIERWGDPDQDGFLEYARQSATGLINQGWKDSHDSIMHANGRLAHAPIRLCEVQGYSFRARMGMSELARILGKTELADRLRLEALQLKIRFANRFWDEEKAYVYLALDGEGEPCRVLSSNMGHCLWGRILQPEQAARVAEHLMSEAMFSGYGIRTLADTELAYNPLSYHNGSVWPHDNSLIVEGFRNYGLIEPLERLAHSLVDVLEASQDFRLPELFCGFRRRENAPPVPYEVACKPQAWAAGSVYLMLRSILGISKELDQNYLVLNTPVLTPKIEELEIRGLKGRDWELDLGFRRAAGGTTVEVLRRHGKIRVLTVK